MGEDFKQGHGILFSAGSRLTYGLPERVGINSERLNKIDSIEKEAVKKLKKCII